MLSIWDLSTEISCVVELEVRFLLLRIISAEIISSLITSVQDMNVSVSVGLKVSRFILILLIAFEYLAKIFFGFNYWPLK